MTTFENYFYVRSFGVDCSKLNEFNIDSLKELLEISKPTDKQLVVKHQTLIIQDSLEFRISRNLEPIYHLDNKSFELEGDYTLEWSWSGNSLYICTYIKTPVTVSGKYISFNNVKG